MLADDAMGQTSSQAVKSSVNEPNMEKKKHKNSKQKRKSLGVEQELDPEQESARALLQMHHGGGLKASPQPNGRTSLQQSPESFTITKTGNRPPHVSLARRESKSDFTGTRETLKEKDVDHFFDPSSNYDGDEDPRLLKLPSTPPNQTDRSSPPSYRLNVSQTQHALDEVSTDDECAMFDQEFGNGKSDTEPPLVDHDIFSFSQQPPETFTERTTPQPMYELPAHAHTLSKASGKRKKRKRRETSEADPVTAQRITPENDRGQQVPSPSHDDALFHTLPNRYSNIANPFGHNEDDEMPIDPELHSMSALPPAVDLSSLYNGDFNTRQTQISKPDLNGSSKPKKRRRMDPQSTSGRQGPSYSSGRTHKDGNDTQGRVHPGSDNIQRQTSPELGTPFIEEVARGGLKYLHDASESLKDTREEGGIERSNTGPPTYPVSSREHEQSKRSLKDVSGKGGTFTTAEIAKLDKFRDKYCEANRMNSEVFNDLIQSSMRTNSQASALFNELQEVLPYRPRISVQKCARRRFHNFSARGTWTAEEDEMLKRAVAERGKSWKVVGSMVDRMPGDCRDRWRNYLNNSEHRNREQWTDDEVRNLCIAILESVQLMKDERRQAREEKYGFGAPEVDEKPDQEAEDMKLINWQVVSDRMGEHGGARSRLQCTHKWARIKKRDRENFLRTLREEREFETAKSSRTKNPWRRVRASKKVGNMKIGDQYTLLQAILDSNAPTEGNIPWKSLGDDDFRTLWNSADKKTAWSKLRQIINGFEVMDYREVANELLQQVLAEGPEELNERWDPRVDVDISAPKPRKRHRSKSKSEGEHRKSNEFVLESDDGDTAETTSHEPSDYNRYNTLPRSEQADRYADVNEEPASESAEETEMNGDEVARDSDQDSLFDGPIERTSEGGDISPTMASKVQLLQYV